MKTKTKFTLTTPVLFLTFNRLDTTKKVFEEIKKAKPKELFLASDGPRENKPEEKKLVEEVRNYILDNIDWKCKVKTLFREKNLGCKYAVSGAIDWFFENVEEGIILEDDCLPSQLFFRFCQEMLERYRNEERIGIISGTNIFNKTNIKPSYYFSSNPIIWGWATWKRVWRDYEVDLKKVTKINFKKEYPNLLERFYKKRKYNQSLSGKINTWDIQLDFVLTINKKRGIIPRCNLVKNIGFSDFESTHTVENYWDKKFLGKKIGTIKFPLIHPENININKQLDKKYIYMNYLRAGLKKIFK